MLLDGNQLLELRETFLILFKHPYGSLGVAVLAYIHRLRPCVGPVMNVIYPEFIRA